jgi:hypothetical protein
MSKSSTQTNILVTRKRWIHIFWCLLVALSFTGLTMFIYSSCNTVGPEHGHNIICNIVFKHPVTLMYLLYTHISVLNATYYLVTTSSSLHVLTVYSHHQVLSVVLKLLHCTSELYIALAETCNEQEEWPDNKSRLRQEMLLEKTIISKTALLLWLTKYYILISTSLDEVPHFLCAPSEIAKTPKLWLKISHHRLTANHVFRPPIIIIHYFVI